MLILAIFVLESDSLILILLTYWSWFIHDIRASAKSPQRETAVLGLLCYQNKIFESGFLARKVIQLAHNFGSRKICKLTLALVGSGERPCNYFT